MKKSSYLYDIDDPLPVYYGVLYGLQWAFIAFPSAIISVSICKVALGLNLEQGIRFLQLTLLVSGAFTFIQSAWGHRYPVIEGPSTAVILTFIQIAPYGLPAIQGGEIIGGILLVTVVLSSQLDRITRLFTPNVVGVILMLISFGLLPALLKLLTGATHVHPEGEASITLISLALVFFMATLSFRLRGFWKTVSILLGMIAGSFVFALLGRLDGRSLVETSWLSFSAGWIESMPGFHTITMVGLASI